MSFNVLTYITLLSPLIPYPPPFLSLPLTYKVKHIRWCLCVPDELPHINFEIDEQGMPHGRKVTNADLHREYKPLINHTVSTLLSLAVSLDISPLPVLSVFDCLGTYIYIFSFSLNISYLLPFYPPLSHHLSTYHLSLTLYTPTHRLS